MTDQTTATKPKSNAGRKPLADQIRKKQRNMYLTDSEWQAVQRYVDHTLRGVPVRPQDEPRTKA